MKPLFLFLAISFSVVPGVSSSFADDYVDQARIRNANAEPQNWFTPGRDENQSYFSPLASINVSNVKRLGLAWQFDLGTDRGQEATPLVVDGIMYTAGNWGRVYALDATTGASLWTFDPNPNPKGARNSCCDNVNRGVALWKGQVYVASIDGQLFALNAKTGHVTWKADTIVDHSQPYASTGSPYLAGDLVVIGNSGGDIDKRGVRGYVSAYNTQTGSLAWRFYTVPPPPNQPPENASVALAAMTWGPDLPPDFKGGGVVWDGFAYDPSLNLLYFGTGNPAPYDLLQVNSFGRDALFTNCIMALKADTGELVWYYQTTPGDQWDFDATGKLVLTDMSIHNERHAVLLQANKNGFFYVLDRANGRLLSATPFTYQNWSDGINPSTGRPKVRHDADWHSGPKNIYPSWGGGHSWQPMSYNPSSRLVYIPVIDASSIWVDLSENQGKVPFIDGFFTTIGIVPDKSYAPSTLTALFGKLPTPGQLQKQRKGQRIRELLRAFDPVAGHVVWEQVAGREERTYDGGIISTAGNLVIQGRADGGLWFYAADTGKPLKVIDTGSHLMASPMSYSVNGIQYIAIQAGYGGTGINAGNIPKSSIARRFENKNRILVFKLDGSRVPKPSARKERRFTPPPATTASRDQIFAGKVTFIEECSRCHSLGPNVTPDLRRLSFDQPDYFNNVLFQGILARRGMDEFSDLITPQNARNIFAYLLDERTRAYHQQKGIRQSRVINPAPE